MRFPIAVRLLAAIVLAASPLMSANAYAGDRVLTPASSTASAVRSLDSQLANMETRSKALGASGKLSAADMAASPDMAYATGMYNGMTSALRSAQTAGESNGAKGEVGSLKMFEELAQRHEARLNRMAAEGDALVGRIRSGAVVIDAGVVGGWPRADQAAFKAFLSPQARAKYPALASIAAADTLEFAALDQGDSIWACSAALPCVAPCYGQQWTNCLNCVIRAGSAIVAAWNTFQSCWSGAGKPKWTPLWVWKAKCLATFVAKLA